MLMCLFPCEFCSVSIQTRGTGVVDGDGKVKGFKAQVPRMAGRENAGEQGNIQLSWIIFIFPCLSALDSPIHTHNLTSLKRPSSRTFQEPSHDLIPLS